MTITREQLVAEEERQDKAHRPGRYRVLIEPWAVYVKDAAYFESQGGLKEKWGERWVEIEAESIYDAREKGKKMRSTS